MRGLIVAAYLGVWSGTAGAGMLPISSGLPCLIHCMVDATGREPTCRYTPSSFGRKFLCGSLAESSGGKSTTINSPWTPTTGYEPTPSPAFVRAPARDIAAACNTENLCCASLFGSHTLCEAGDITINPSLRFREAPERLSSTNSGFQPNFERTIAISFAKFCASGSFGTTWISILVPAQRSNPANQILALGSSLKPSKPTCLGINTVCSARFSACKLAVSLFSAAVRSMAFDATSLANETSFAASALYFSRASSFSFSSTFELASLILPDTTIAYVAATPIINAATNIQLAHHDTSSADIWRAPLIMLPFVVLVAISGIGVMIYLFLSRYKS
jgi:hypothetical protein